MKSLLLKSLKIFALLIIVVIPMALAICLDLHFTQLWKFPEWARGLLEAQRQKENIYNYIKGCVTGIYDLKSALFGAILTGIGILWAVQSVLYEGQKSYVYGITFDEIYKRTHKNALFISRWILILGAPGSILCLLINFTMTSLILFIIVFMNLLLVSCLVVLMAEPAKRRKACLKAMKKELPFIKCGAEKLRIDCLFYKILESNRYKEPDTELLINSYIDMLLRSHEVSDKMKPLDYFHEFYYISKLILLRPLKTEGDVADVAFLQKCRDSITAHIQSKLQQNSSSREYLFRCLSASLGMLIAATVCCEGKSTKNNKAVLLLEDLLYCYNRTESWKNYGHILVAAWIIFIELAYEEGQSIGSLVSYLKCNGFLNNSQGWQLINNEEQQNMVLALSVLYADLDPFSYEKVLLVCKTAKNKNVKETNIQSDSYTGLFGIWEDFIWG